MARSVYLHIGAPKTGTTAIQAACADAAQQLEAAGFHYLKGDRNHSERLALAFWQQHDANRLAALRNFTPGAVDQTALRDQLAQEIEACDPHDVILSGEEVSGFDKGELNDLIEFLLSRFSRIKVIAYVRDPVSWMNSAAQQAVKWSGDTLEGLFRRPRLPNYPARFEAALNAIPPEDQCLRFYNSSDFDVVADFAEILGIEPKTLAVGNRPRENTALSAEAAIALSAVNEASPPFVEYTHNPCRAFGVVAACRLPGHKFVLPHTTIQSAAENLAEERDWIEGRLGRIDVLPQSQVSVFEGNWFGCYRKEWEAFGISIAEKVRAAQNEKSLKSLLRARNRQATEPERAADLLSDAALLATDRWTMGEIAEAAVSFRHADRLNFFAKQRLMRRIEEPAADDPALAKGNPFDRFWREDRSAARAL
ncbi:MAG: hypothetical protein AAF718_06395 [Pseudomonadota bacterium]